MYRSLAVLCACVLVVTGACAAAPETSSGGAAPGAAVEKSRPNVVLILTDDQRKDDLRWTPEARRLIGRQGVKFRNAITPNPVCCPTRVSLLTGQFSHNSGVLATGGGRYGGFRAYTKGTRNPHNDIGRWMKSAGYRTGFVGKFLNAYSTRTAQRLGTDSLGPRGWDFWDATVQGGTNYTDFTFANNGDPVRYTDSYTTRVASDRAIARIDDWAPGEKPFFLSLSYAAPHKHQAGGRQHAAKPERKYRGTVTARNPDERTRAFNRVAENTRFSFRSRVKASKMRQNFRRRAEALKSVDDGVAKIVRALKSHGELGNTLIIFTSDNGFSLGQHRWLGKRWPFEVEMRVPLMMRGPGVPRGISTPRWVTPVDIARTIVDAGNATPRRRLDGRSFLGVDGNESSRPRAIPIETGNQQAQRKSDRKWHYRGLWYGRYIYVKHPQTAELYDLRKDPHQLQNRIRWDAYERIKRRLARKSTTLGSCSGARECYRGRFWLPKPG